MSKKYMVITSLFIFLSLIFLTKLFVDHLFIEKTSSSSFMYNQCEKVWGHRGYFKTHQGNSLNAFREAFNLGAKGTELDIFYDVEMNDFVVSHDFPYHLKEGKLLTLDEVFHTFGNAYYYWLDFKNSYNMSENDMRYSVSKMIQLTEKYKVKDQVIIESRDHVNIFQLSKAGFNTSFWASFNRRAGLEYSIYSYVLKIKYILGYFSAISMAYTAYTSRVKESFPGLPVLLFTINDELTVDQYILDESVKVILSDENYYSHKDNTCISK